MLCTRTMGGIGAVILGFLALNTGVASLFDKGYSYQTWWHGLGFWTISNSDWNFVDWSWDF